MSPTLEEQAEALKTPRVYTDDEILKALPHDHARKGQIAAIRFALEAWDSGKRFVIIEAPTGAGKSGMGIALSNFFDNSYYLTIQKILQAQIIRDYERVKMVEVKGRNAYPCTFYDLHAQKLLAHKMIPLKVVQEARGNKPDCMDGYCKKHVNKSKCAHCFPPRSTEQEVDAWKARHGVDHSTCPYYEQVLKAVKSPKVLMNFSSFMYQTQYTPRFNQRELMIIDEAHHSEPQLMDFVSLTISDLPFLPRGIKLPELEDAEEYAVWFHDNNIEHEIGRMVKDAKEKEDSKAEDDATRLFHRYSRFMQCIAEGMVDWICEYKELELTKTEKFSTVTFRPVYVRHFANDMLFKYGKRVLLMSATILDAGIMASNLGIDKDDIAFFRMGNYFPKENRPIYIESAAKMVGGQDKMDTWAGPMVKKVDDIMGRYPKERGIIHTHNFKIADLLLRQCRTNSRFLFQKNFRDKETMLAEHARRPNGVIVAPAIHEGLDLRDDLSRFQIIAKVPYPNFFDDKQLARRVDLDRNYLTWLVALKLVQSYGRSIRSGDDWAHTYIIDGAIDRFLREADKMLPTWFKEAVIRKPSGK